MFQKRLPINFIFIPHFILLCSVDISIPYLEAYIESVKVYFDNNCKC